MAAEAPSEMGSGLGASSPAEVEQLRAYLLRVVPALLEEDVLPDLSVFEGSIWKNDSTNFATRILPDANVDANVNKT